MQLFDKVRPRRTYEEVAARIRRAFADGSLKTGDRLPPEAELAEHLGVSRGAVREALRSLQASGVVELRKGGATVSVGQPRVLVDNLADLLHLQGVTIEQLTEVRLWIEEIVVRAACRRATEADLKTLQANVDQAQALFNQGRMLEKAVVNIRFHDLLAQATQNPLLVIVVNTLTEVMTAFVQQNGVDRSRSTFTSRRRFMAAMCARDEEAAVDEMRGSLRRVHRLYLRLAREAAAR